MHPLIPGFDPDFRHDLDALLIDRRDCLLGQRLRAHEPLLRNQRFHHTLAALALTQRHRVVLHLLQNARRFQVFHHSPARFIAIKARILTGRRGHVRGLIDDLNQRQVVALARFEIVGIVRGRNLNCATAEFRIGHLVANHRDLAIHQRQRDRGQTRVTLIAWIDRNGSIAQHGFRTRRRHRQGAVADVPHVPGGFFVNGFEVADGRIAAGAPVDHVLAAVNHAALIQIDKDFTHRARKAGVEGEALARPVARRPDLDHLALNRAAGFRLPFPDFFLEFLARQVAAVEDAFRLKLPRNDQFRGDARVVRAGQP